MPLDLGNHSVELNIRNGIQPQRHGEHGVRSVVRTKYGDEDTWPGIEMAVSLLLVIRMRGSRGIAVAASRAGCGDGVLC